MIKNVQIVHRVLLPPRKIIYDPAVIETDYPVVGNGASALVAPV